ncbi:MAG: hypothetical protein ACI9EF_002980 [Pseudohongiellaceae bacterium]|jgi:hypothetical protein
MRRNRSRGGFPSYDSILDTMTNVVGILIIVVAVTQLSVADAVSRTVAAEADTPAVDVDAREEARQHEAQLRADLLELRDRWGQLSRTAPEDSVQLGELRRSIRELALEVGDPTNFEEVGETVLQEEVAELESEFESLEALELEESELLSDLMAKLDDTQQTLEDRQSLRLPHSDASRSQGKQKRIFWCARGEVFLYDEASLQAQAMAEIAKTVGGKVDGLTIQQITRGLKKTIAHFEDDDIGDRDFQIRVAESEWRGFACTLDCDLRASANGDGVDELDGPRPKYQAELSKLDPTIEWIRFQVWDDSFEVYQKARSIAEEAGFAVGWKPRQEDHRDEWNIVSQSSTAGAGDGPTPD